MQELLDASAVTLARYVRQKKVSPVELLDVHVARIVRERGNGSRSGRPSGSLTGTPKRIAFGTAKRIGGATAGGAAAGGFTGKS